MTRETFDRELNSDCNRRDGSVGRAFRCFNGRLIGTIVENAVAKEFEIAIFFPFFTVVYSKMHRRTRRTLHGV
jgi:hypothetical protein